MAKYLIDNGADVNKFDNNEKNPLLKACEISKTIVEYLVEKGASLNVKDYSECSPIHIAAETGSTSICRFLHEKKAKMSRKNDQGVYIFVLYLMIHLYLLQVFMKN